MLRESHRQLSSARTRSDVLSPVSAFPDQPPTGGCVLSGHAFVQFLLFQCRGRRVGCIPDEKEAAIARTSCPTLASRTDGTLQCQRSLQAFACFNKSGSLQRWREALSGFGPDVGALTLVHSRFKAEKGLVEVTKPFPPSTLSCLAGKRRVFPEELGGCVPVDISPMYWDRLQHGAWLQIREDRCGLR